MIIFLLGRLVFYSFFFIYLEKYIAEQQFIISLRITVWSAVKVKHARVTLALPEISITDRFSTLFNPMSKNIVERKMSVPNDAVERWWPNSIGNQKLYKLIASVSYEGSLAVI